MADQKHESQKIYEVEVVDQPAEAVASEKKEEDGEQDSSIRQQREEVKEEVKEERAMSDTLPVYGLDADLKAYADRKYDPYLEKEVTDWIIEITGEDFESKGADTFAMWLQDGQILCNLVNKIFPERIKKINTMQAPFKKMENITKFTDVVRELGVPEASMFATPDLYEEKNIGSVVACIYTFARVVQTAAPNFDGPKLGEKMEVMVSRNSARQKQVPTQTGGLAGTLHDEKKATGQRERAAQAGNAEEDGADAQGLDADMKRVMDAKFDAAAAAEVCRWIEEVTGEKQGDQSMAEWLKSGVVLCALANAIKPGSATGVKDDGKPFNQMENIKKFLGMARGIGMNESSMFSTPDLFEEKNMAIVVTALFTFGGFVQAKVPEYTGPKIGVAVKAEVADGSRGIGLITEQTNVFQGVLETERPKDHQIIRPIDKTR